MVARGASSHRFQALRQLFVDAAEAAIGKNSHDVTWPHFRRDRLHDRIGVGNDARAPPLRSAGRPRA